MECFFSPDHEPAARAVRFAVDGGEMRPVAACAECASSIEAGRAPACWRPDRPPVPEAAWHTGTSRGSRGWGFLPRLFGFFDDLI